MAFGMAGRPKRKARLIAAGMWPPPGHGSGVSKKAAKRGPPVIQYPARIDKFDPAFWEANGFVEMDFYGESPMEYSSMSVDCDEDWREAGFKNKRECLSEMRKSSLEIDGQAQLELGGWSLVVMGEGGDFMDVMLATSEDSDDPYKQFEYAETQRKLGVTIPTHLDVDMNLPLSERKKLVNAWLGKWQGAFIAFVRGQQVGGFLAGMF